MSTSIAKGSKATYKGKSSKIAFQMRNGIECVVVDDTPEDSDKVKVLFMCEDVPVNVLAKKLHWVDKKTKDN